MDSLEEGGEILVLGERPNAIEKLREVLTG